MSLSPGSVIAEDYRIESALAQGGMGAVFIATQLSTGRRRALKVMHPTMVLDAASRARFLEEARIGSRIESDHVVEVVGAGIDASTNSPWLAMELLEGETLEDRIRSRGPIPRDELRRIVVGLRHALGRAHALGIVHRDLKPENLFLATSRSVGEHPTLKILDFGIAKLLHDGRTAATQNIAGSPMWMAPEQADGHAIRPSTDVWALGLIAFYAVTGVPYWKAASGETTLTKLLFEVLTEPLDPPSVRALAVAGPQAASLLPPGFDSFFARAVDRDSKARFANATEALDALELVLAGGATDVPAAVVAFAQTMVGVAPASSTTSHAASPSPAIAASTGAIPFLPPSPPRSRWAVVAGAVGLIGVGASVAAFVISSQRSGDRELGVSTLDPGEGPTAPSTAANQPTPPTPPAKIETSPPPTSGAATEVVPRTAPGSEPTPAPSRVVRTSPTPTSAPTPAPQAAPTPAPQASPPTTPAAPATTPAPAVEPEMSDEEAAWARTEASRFRATIVAPCWTDNPPADGAGADVTVAIGFGASGSVSSVRIDGTTNMAFRQCTVIRGTNYRVSSTPLTNRVVVRARLAGN